MTVYLKRSQSLKLLVRTISQNTLQAAKNSGLANAKKMPSYQKYTSRQEMLSVIN